MKIAFLNLYAGINNRGAETFSDELAHRLGKNHEIKFFRGADYKISFVQPTHSIELLKLFFLDEASLSVLKFTLKIFKELWNGNYDLIVPMNGFWQVLLCKFIFKSKILITGHSGPGWDEKWNLWLKPNVFIATTKPAQIWAKTVSPWTRVEMIPYGVDLEKYAVAQQVKLNLEKPIILCPAAAVSYKRVELAIQAVSKLKIGSLLHLGSGPEKEKLSNLGESLLGKERFQTNSVSFEEMPKYYAACSVVTLPSALQENSPMVFIEALAAGKQIVVTDSPRARWILGDAASYVDPIDLDSYAKVLESASKDKDNSKILAQAKNYSWDKIIEKYNKLFAAL